jgi:3-oxoacyl-[acyl-carrier-protein] synthase II
MTIFVTGVGIISAAGKGEEETLECFYEGRRNAGPVSLFASDIKSPVYEVRDLFCGHFPERLRTLNLCLAAIDDALEGNCSVTRAALKGKRIGVAIGTTVGSILNDLDFYREYRKTGKASMVAVDHYLQGDLASVVHSFLETHGPSVTVVNACTSGADAIGMAMSWIKAGLCEIAIAGGSDEMNQVPLSGFRSLGILSDSLCAPFDRNRNGLNLGEAAAVLILENETSLRQRGQRARAIIRGYGSSNDAHHLTAPDPDGQGLERAVTTALKAAAIRPDQISFINVHGTATRDNDCVEGLVLSSLFGRQAKFLSTKGYTGHTLGAAGVLEACFSLLALEQEWIPQSAGFSEEDPTIGISPVKERTSIEGQLALSTSLGFGGCDAALVIERPKEEFLF